jgi:Yip1 domain
VLAPTTTCQAALDAMRLAKARTLPRSNAMRTSFARRIIGAARLETDIYEEIEADRTAMGQALTVVLLSSIAAGIGSGGRTGWAVLGFVVNGAVFAVMTWGAWSYLTFEIGSRILATPETRTDRGELLRTLGFATAPGFIQVFGLLPGAMVPVFTIAILWTLVASIVAVRQALDFTSTARAVAVCALSLLLSLAVALTLGMLLASPVSGAGGR